MSGDLYQSFFDSQKKMFEEWQGNMQTAFKKFSEGSGLNADPSGYYSNLYESSQDFLKKVGESSKVYQSIFELWKNLGANIGGLDNKSTSEAYDAWLKKFSPLIKELFLPHLPDYMQHFAENFFEKFESTSITLGDYFKTYAVNEESLQKAFFSALSKGPKGYVEFLEAWQRSYDETFGKLLNAPTFGKDMDFWKQQKSAFDRFIKFHIAATKFYTALVDIAQEATKKVTEDYIALTAKGEQPKTFDEFYKYWAKIVSSSYEKVLFSGEISTLAGHMIDEMSNFKAEFDKLFELYMANIPIPKKSDLDDLYKTVYELKKEVRSLKKEVRNLTKSPEK
ncbi:MAG: hypothetical protein LBO77_02360 [Desulfovibrio sp.]|jgi:hypothetical protein|nr:hypothetical protein [Desulfovibrio sp.]